MKNNIAAFFAALIWGTAFVAQSVCSEYLGPFTVNAIRAVIATIVLFIIALIAGKLKKNKEKRTKAYYKNLVISGIVCGIALAVATNLQQAGIGDTGAGKSAFITAMYVVIVPVLSFFTGKKIKKNIVVSLVICVIGFYFLCLYGEGVTFAVSDLYVLLCSFVFALHIIIIDKMGENIDGIELSCVQFAVVAIISSASMFIFEDPQFSNVTFCFKEILYIGVFSSGIAYTLEIIAIKGANPTVVTLLMSLESVFAVLAEYILPGTEKGMLSYNEIVGCILIFTAVVISQLKFSQKSKPV